MAPTGETRIQLWGRFVARLEGQRIEDSLPGLAMHSDARAVAVDIPLGIIETYGREADTAARRFIQPRGGSGS